MAKKKKERIGTIKGIDLVKKSAPIQDILFKTGKYMTEKDRPRDKNWRQWDDDMEQNEIEMDLQDLQPSQFYISEKKLKDVEEWFDPSNLSNFEPIPVKLLDGIPVMTDGHTRAVAAIRAGLDSVPLVWDDDELNWDMYRACVSACQEQEIFSPVDLLMRIISEDDYKEKWDKWCDIMQAEIMQR